MNVDILRPAIKEADVSSLTWERVTEVEGSFDGVRGFAIDAATGVVSVADPSVVDFEVNPSFNLTVTASDAAGISNDKTFVVSVSAQRKGPQSLL